MCRLAADWDLLLQQPPLPAQAPGFGIDWKGEPDTPLCAPATLVAERKLQDLASLQR